MDKKRVLTGDRPTGRMHIGHYVGSLKSRVALQNNYECFFIVADIHTLTTRHRKQQISQLGENIRQMVLDYLAVGLDPARSTIFVQSAVPESFELNTLLGMLASVPRLERIPSLKEMAVAANLKTIPLGLLGYPVLMAADILLPRARLVPIGEDNQANGELARELARRFNHLYGDTFPIPDLQIEGTLVGTDGFAKMSKSRENAIFLSDDPETVTSKVMRMYTDPHRLTANTPGKVEGNPVFIYHEAFNANAQEVEELKARYRCGKVGDVEVKRKLANALNAFLDPIRARRTQFERDTAMVTEILAEGNRRMRAEAHQTIELVRQAMGIHNYYVAELARTPDSATPYLAPLQGLAYV